MESFSLGDVWKELGNLGMGDLSDFPIDKEPGWVGSYLNRLNTSSPPPTSPPLTDSEIISVYVSNLSSPTMTTISSASSFSSPGMTSLLSHANNTPHITPEDRNFLHTMSDQHFTIIRMLREVSIIHISTLDDTTAFVTGIKRALQEMRAWLLRFCQQVQPLAADNNEYGSEGGDARRRRHQAMVGALAPVVETICLFYDFWGHEERAAGLRDERDNGRLKFVHTEIVYPSQPKEVSEAKEAYYAEYPGCRIGWGGDEQGSSEMGGGSARVSLFPLVGYSDGDSMEQEEEAGISGFFAQEYSA